MKMKAMLSQPMNGKTEKARGCRIEHAVAEAYGLTILYEEETA